MDSTLILPFIKSTQNIFGTMFQMEVSCGAPEVKRSEHPSHDVSAIISMSGDIEGSVVLSFPMDTARRAVAVFTGSDGPMSDEDLSDAVGELVNMIAGGAKAQFQGRNVAISCPSVVIGPSHAVFGAKDIVRVVIPCSCDCGDFNVEVLIKPGKNAAKTAAGAASSAA
ncbi:MAG: chemotaxis protein CheX [Planctomycetota bacterium]|nr:chemotaxis protein CheX [Planctomycetota bacterium]